MKTVVSSTTKVQRPDNGEILAQEAAAALGSRADLCLLFATAHFDDQFEKIANIIGEQLGPRALIGATAETVVAGELEFESQPAIALFAASLPGVGISAFHLLRDDLERVDSAEGFRQLVEVPADRDANFIALADPFSFPVLDLIEIGASAFPGRPIVGGLASAAEGPDQNMLIFDGHPQRRGMVGVGLWGNIQLDTIVSQGCRPIGKHMVITKAEKNVIYQLGGRPALNVVNDMLEEVSPRDMEMLKQRGLLVGRVINEYQPSFARGDFLIRNPLGFDQGSGAMAVNDFVRTGQTIQFHVRDSQTADEDLQSLLSSAAKTPPAGALLFTCNGRGQRLFNHRHHDARLISDVCGNPPAAGFFCAGEIGPVGGRNFLHGHTASIALLRPLAKSANPAP